MFNFAHLSDPHLTTLKQIPWSALINKRLMGYISWKTHRRAEHRREVLDLLRSSLQEHHLDHIVVTGDLTHLGLPQEFQEARQWLDSLNSIADTTVIPGNHETYIPTSYQATLKQWTPYFQSDSQEFIKQAPSEKDTPCFPSLRLRGPVAFIGVSSACPTPPFLATGRIDSKQMGDLEQILRSPSLKGFFKVLLIHHPPIPGSTRWRKRLTNAAQLSHILSQHPVNLILHGHTHQCSVAFLDTLKNDPIPVIGMPSASAKGIKPGYQSQYCLFHLNQENHTFRLSASLYHYIPEKEQFTFSRPLPLP